MRRSCTKCGVCRASRSPTTRSFSRTETVMQADPGQEREALTEIERMATGCGGLSWSKALERLTAVRDVARAALAAREEPQGEPSDVEIIVAIAGRLSLANEPEHLERAVQELLELSSLIYGRPARGDTERPDDKEIIVCPDCGRERPRDTERPDGKK